MAAITVSNPSIGFADAGVTLVTTETAGEAIGVGKAVSYDKGQTDDNLYLITIADADRRRFEGFAHSVGGAISSSIASGTKFRLQRKGVFLGGQFDPAGTALHRTGNLVYTADAGAIQDSGGTLTNCHRIGFVIKYGTSGNNKYGIIIDPDYTLQV